MKQSDVMEAEFMEVSKEDDLKQILQDILASIVKDFPKKPRAEFHFESQIILKLATKGYKISKMEIQ